MADVKWIRIAIGIFDDDKIKLIAAMPRGDSILVLWFRLICLAGSLNADGDLIMTNGSPYTVNELSVIFGKPLKIVQAALDMFKQYGMVNINGGVINLTNWEKHQNAEGLEKIREQTKIRTQEYRRRINGKNSDVTKNMPRNAVVTSRDVTSNATVTRRDATEKEIDIDKDIEPPIVPLAGDEVGVQEKRFSAFWEAYPRKIGKQSALKAWNKIKPDADLCAKILDAISRADLSEQWKKDNGRYIPYPTTWLNRGGWEDEYHMTAGNNGSYNLDEFIEAAVRRSKEDYERTAK